MLQLSQPLPALLKLAEQQQKLTPLARHFALNMAAIHQQADDGQITPEDAPLLMLLCALISQAEADQHTCLNVALLDLANPLQLQLSPESPQSPVSFQGDHQALITYLATHSWFTRPMSPILVESDPSHQQAKLYLKRYYDYEQFIATRMQTMAQQQYPISQAMISALPHLFPPFLSPTESTIHAQTIDWQKVASLTALSKQFSVITGGPGTGKTTTVTKLLLLLQLDAQQNTMENNASQGKLQIKLVAPTGKAAARLSESIKGSKKKLAQQLNDYPDYLAAIDAIPEEASTLHRLLGVIPNAYQFRHHQENPIQADVLIIDEASMVDLRMMTCILKALAPETRLILLGDQDQLPSVEVGAVLADLCQGLATNNPQSPWQMRYSPAFTEQLSELCQQDFTDYTAPKYTAQKTAHIGDNLCMLQYSHRFRDDAGIGVLAKAVNQSQTNKLPYIWQHYPTQLTWLEQELQPQNTEQALAALLVQACEQYRQYLILMNRSDHQAHELIERYNQYRILCATRTGIYGVDGVNEAVVKALTQAGLIDSKQEFYAGRPIMIETNDYNLGLFNGDIGVLLPDQQTGHLMAHFIQADQSLLKILPARLPKHQTCFAMTVHKSQGSEFENVALVLPLRPNSNQWQLLTKELIYTAITRAKSHFSCLGTMQVFARATKQKTQRESGLAQRLWGETCS